MNQLHPQPPVFHNNGYQTQNLHAVPQVVQSAPVFGPDHDTCVQSAQKLEETTVKQKKPFVTRLKIAWMAAGIATVVMGAAMFVVLDGVLGWPVAMALVMALTIQAAAIWACHAWLHGQWTYDPQTFQTEKPLNLKLVVLVVAMLFMIVLSFLRGKMFIEEMGLGTLMTAVCAFILALIDPAVSLMMGALTASATSALVHPQDMTERAVQHRDAVLGKRGNAWPTALTQAQKERDQLVNLPLSDSATIHRRNNEVKHVENWIKKLELFDPTP